VLGDKEVQPGTTSGRAGLPDDLQHALDIIYHGVGGKPGAGPKAVTFPIPEGATAAVQAPEEYSDPSFNYMDYQPYQESFEGYVSADYQDEANSAATEEASAPVEDDMDDLRMLGIDVEDTAASNFK